jgi:Tfp pilus assembly protein PilW
VSGRRRRTRACGLLDLLVGLALGLLVLGGLVAAVAAGARLVVVAAVRAEVEDTAHLALEALTFDVRRAGWDPTRSGLVPVTDARADGVATVADLDGDGLVDATSEETAALRCGAARLSRTIGRQSMPLADGVAACRFGRVDGAGDVVDLPTGGLADAERAAIRAVALELTVTSPLLGAATSRRALLALRAVP